MKEVQTGKRFTYGSFYDPRGKIKLADLPCPYLVVNLVVQNMTPLNGPIRIVPYTQHRHELPPSLDDEPIDWKAMTLDGVEKGALLIRDA